MIQQLPKGKQEFKWMVKGATVELIGNLTEAGQNKRWRMRSNRLGVCAEAE